MIAPSSAKGSGDPPLRVAFSRAARRAMGRMKASVSRRLAAELDDIARAPLAYRSALAPCMGRAGAFRLSLDPWLVLLSVDRKARVLHVESIVYFGER